MEQQQQHQNPPAVNPDYHTQQQQYPPPDQSQQQYPQYQQQYQQPQQPPQQQQPQGYPPPPQQQQEQSLYPQVAQPQQMVPPPPEMAVIVCWKCQHENLVPMTVLSLACARCGAPNEKPKAPDNPPSPAPPAFMPSDSPEVKEEVQEEKKVTYLSDYVPDKQTKLEVPDMGPPFFFPSMREWKWKVSCRGKLEFEVDLKYEPRHCQEDMTLTRKGKTIALATFSFGKYKITTPEGDAIAQLTVNKGFMGGGEGEFVIQKEYGMKPGPLRVHIARMGTHKLYQGERMVVRWAIEHSILTIETEEDTDVALLLFAVCCFERWG